MPSLGLRYQRLSNLVQAPGRVTATAQDRLLGRVRVLKLAAADSVAARELSAEADRLASLSHPRLVALVDRFERATGLDANGSVSGFATDWVDGQALGRRLRATPLETRLDAFGQLLRVVSYLHRCGLLHLDIKPDNVLLGPDGVMLLDLGTARPLDAGPGEAGGTLGFAAPEVLGGQAAGVQADLFSLGALLYELVSGSRPFGDLAGSALRHAVLAGEAVPLRACAPDAPPALAALVARLMAPRVVDRPADIDEVADVLAAQGVAMQGRQGAPPFAGRSDEIQEVLSAIAGGGVVGVIGPAGSGRRRLCQELLGRGLVRAIDLSGLDDARVPLGRLAVALGADAPVDVNSPEWIDAVCAALAGGVGEPRLLVFGRREDRDRTCLESLDRIAAAFCQGGGAVLWVGRDPIPDATNVVLGPLRPSAVADVGLFFGRPLSHRMEGVLERTGGWPGSLILSLSKEPIATTEHTARAWRLFQALPDGTPPAVLTRLPSWAMDAVPELVALGLLRRSSEDLLYAVRPCLDVSDQPEIQAALADLSADLPDGVDVHWATVLASRQHLPVDLGPLVAQRLSLPVARLEELSELAERELARDTPGARSLLVGVRFREGSPQGALDLLEDSHELDQLDRILYARSLRRVGRVASAKEVLDEFGETDDPIVILERGFCSLQLGGLDEASLAIERLLALPEFRRTSPARTLHALVVHSKVRAGQPVEDIDDLVQWALTAPGSEVRLAGGALAHVLRAQGQIQQSLVLYERSVRNADVAGYPRPAAGSRINLANALVDAGRTADAREVLQQALLLARRGGDRLLVAHVIYNLARIDLHSGRVPDAETRIVEYEALVTDMTRPEVHLRGALNRAWLHLLLGEPEPALTVLDLAPSEKVSPDALSQRTHLRAWALLELGRAEEVLEELGQDLQTADDPALGVLVSSLRGRAYLALGRRYLGEARRDVGALESGGAMRPVVGEILLAWAGEDIDPASFPERREALSLSAQYLRGPLAARAVRLRERMLDGPGANLDGIVKLTEAMHDPEVFPEALAQLVREALGAHRVLIMLRMPGLGHQVGFTELSGAQAAGIGREVMERIQRPDDVWMSGDAFGDPELRESSQTVQTFELKSLLAVAIPRGDRAIGALYVDDLYRTHRFDDEDVHLLQRLARAVGRMVPLIKGEVQRDVPDPSETLGVILSDPDHKRELDEALEMLEGAREANVLVTGPTGAGKSFLARRLAEDALGTSGVEMVVLRKGDPQMLVTQLMGSRRGEFTGATDREGAITRCLREGKALFLDEIQNLDETGQQILLPLLDLPRSFGTLTGSAQQLNKPLHIILGTNHDVLGNKVFDVFRTDLWYRMSRIHIFLPPLVERGAEVVYQYLARLLANRNGPPPEEIFETAALYRVTHAPWPGNLRELDAFAERALHLSLARERALGTDDLRTLRLAEDESGVYTGRSRRTETDASLDGAMIQHVMTVLRRHEWVQKYAAGELGMNAPTLNKFLKRNGLLDEVRRRRQLGA